MFYYYGIDYTYILFVLPAVIFTFIAQAQVNGAFRKYQNVMTARHMTGAQVAERMLQAFGVQGIRVERTTGRLSDHFSPKESVIRLSDEVYHGTSVAAAGIAAHECGHAAQHASGYGPIRFRNAIIPISQLGSGLAVPLVLAGFIFNFQILVTAGIVFFAAAALFQLVTLPVEFNASSRAMETLQTAGILSEEESVGAKRVLRAAALTYVAALAVSLAQLLRLVLLANRRRD